MSNQEIPVVDLNVEKQLSQSEDNSGRVENEVNLKANTNQLADSIENQSEIQRRSARARTLTEKGQAYQEQRQKEKEKEEDHLTKKFNKTYNTWEVSCRRSRIVLGLAAAIITRRENRENLQLRWSP